ncbi:DEAD/DEAH box helicase [Aquisalinus flavus]|uniref:Type III restriction endonuclease n=1 Tax=Aquisalinus flavus TaxID=1526572 RepID=A0A8J2Y6Q8_9PROT|nr:DEAD/DEAH box helicase family protein [Aquisalinus flavus]MBD0425804.1 DEAD/DEAH box helicase family protein [Aquisalinus flavus]UNE48590.1 restriction endonuclease subunit R [Aquisalinus flavus]GGD13097.1 type III restriction endonuclease [Aquisalinus flavus]
MAKVNFEPRNYQLQALDDLSKYLKRIGDIASSQGDAITPAAQAFAARTGRGYVEAPDVASGTPYVCVRIPTGGGKTLVAAHSVGVVARDYLQTDNPMVLWLVPSTTIRDQTLNALRNLDHPYRAALEENFGRNLSVMTVDEALSLSRPDAEGGACIIVATMQAFRVEQDKDSDARRVYRDNGNLMDHFSGLDAAQKMRLEMVEGTNRPVASLENVLRLHRPMVIVDEAHNSRTPLSYETLSRFQPAVILELTATPQLKNDPDNGQYASNVLFHVSAAELKAAEMIKMPIRLETDPDWRQTVGKALDARAKLEEMAKAEEAETGAYIRPIILFQAQAKSKNDPHRIVPETLLEHLTNDKNIPREQIALHGVGFKELDDIEDIEARDCPVRYVITVQALKEGWDCPFAYVLCSVAELGSATAVEQILGRVLRMPGTVRKRREELNRAYAFVASKSFQSAAASLRDGLVDGAGFERLEAKDMVQNHGGYDLAEDPADYVYDAEPLPEDETTTQQAVETVLSKLPPKLKERVSYDGGTRKLSVRGRMSKEDRNLIILTTAKVKGADRQVDRLFRRSNRITETELPEGDAEKPPFIVPRLGVFRQGELELFTPDHFLDLPWNLAACDPARFLETFRIKDGGIGGEVDIDEKGKLRISTIEQVQGQLAAVVREPAWTLPRLVNWIDKGIHHPDVTKPAARIFIQTALEKVMEARGYSLDELARHKYAVVRELRTAIEDLRKKREQESYGALFAADASRFETSAEIGIVFDEIKYIPDPPYRGARKFDHHYFPIIGDLKSHGEEFDCACHLDEHPDVRYWLRNVDRKPNSFWLQLPSARFYPDFVAMLHDGRILVVEYKGADRFDNPSEQEKLKIGNLWADASGGQCLFVMPTRRDFKAIDRVIETGK